MSRSMRIVVAVSLVAATVLALPGAASARIRAREVIGDLDQPVAFTFGPGRSVWYAERVTGQVRVHDLDTGRDRAFVTVPGVDADGERGLLGIVLHPRFPDRPFVYVYATRTVDGDLRNEILRYRDVGGSGLRPRVLFSSPASSSPYHNGGRILFGPDGMLYAVVGDAHDAANAQDLSDDRGKILRIEPDGDVPPTNPFDSRVLAFGIRNSFGFAFDPRTDQLWETDNGPECNDEINPIDPGANYGWGPNETCAGTAPGNTNQDGPDPVLPALFFPVPIGITGIAFCDGCGLGARNADAAFVGAVNTGEIVRIEFDAARGTIEEHAVVVQHDGSTLSLEVGPGGGIFFSDFTGIHRLVRVRSAASQRLARDRARGVRWS